MAEVQVGLNEIREKDGQFVRGHFYKCGNVSFYAFSKDKYNARIKDNKNVFLVSNLGLYILAKLSTKHFTAHVNVGEAKAVVERLSLGQVISIIYPAIQTTEGILDFLAGAHDNGYNHDTKGRFTIVYPIQD